MRLHPVHSGLNDRRRRLLSAARGRVVEVGGGNGLNLAHYRDVESVTVVEQHVATRMRLMRRVAQARVPVTVHEADVLELGALGPEVADTVVCTLALCLVDDVPASLAAIASIMKPDARLLFLEHV